MEDIISRTAAPIGRPQGQRNKQLEKGCGFARLVQLIATTRGNDMQAQRMAQQFFPDTPGWRATLKGARSA